LEWSSSFLYFAFTECRNYQEPQKGWGNRYRPYCCHIYRPIYVATVYRLLPQPFLLLAIDVLN